MQGGTKDYLKNVVEKDLKQQIDNAIFEIFKTFPREIANHKKFLKNLVEKYSKKFL